MATAKKKPAAKRKTGRPSKYTKELADKICMLYTTNSIEALNRGVRKVVKTRTLFPHEESAKKLIYLALQRIMEIQQPYQSWFPGTKIVSLKCSEHQSQNAS